MGGALLTCKKSGDAVAPEVGALDIPEQQRLGRDNGAPPAAARPPRPQHTTQHQHQRQAGRAHRQGTNKKLRQRARPAGTPLRPIATATIDYTPVAKADRERFKYSCPLCFCYFDETILVTSCCGNYTCYECSLDHVKQKGGVGPRSTVLPAKLNGVPCPHCNTEGVQFSYVSTQSEVRSYDTSPATKARMDKLGQLSFRSPRPLSPTEESRLEQENQENTIDSTSPKSGPDDAPLEDGPATVVL